MSRTAILLSSLLAVAGCNEQSEIDPGPSSGGTGSGGVAGSAGAKTQCPHGLAGPKLARLPGPNDTYYCMDEREVVNAEYQEFLTALGGTIPSQPPECNWNERLEPEIAYPDDDLPNGKCPVSYWNINPDFAVGCVDFCDAFAYCHWAGKRLCSEQGQPGDSVNVFANYDDLGSTAASTGNEWFNACSQGGMTTYPYGNTYESGRCVDSAKFTAEGNPALATKSVETDTCAGTVSPYDAVHHLSGNVYEWTNFCVDDGGSCKIQGGSYGAVPSELLCSNPGVTSTPVINPLIGFRCCADTVAP